MKQEIGNQTIWRAISCPHMIVSSTSQAYFLLLGGPGAKMSLLDRLLPPTLFIVYAAISSSTLQIQ